jgi:NAD(P)-dependent dehydrogenase (short-subunit alcohol dehydrogenase family)
MDHLARAVALEEAERSEAGRNGAKIVSLAPGIIDTDMQVTLRTADRTRFPERDRFLGFKTAGQLDSPATAAAKLLRYVDRADFGSNPVGDVRDV